MLVSVSSIHEFTQRIWAPPVTELLRYSASNTAMCSKYARNNVRFLPRTATCYCSFTHRKLYIVLYTTRSCKMMLPISCLLYSVKVAGYGNGYGQRSKWNNSHWLCVLGYSCKTWKISYKLTLFLTLFCKSTLDPLERRSCTTSVCPLLLAPMRAVKPSWGTQWDKIVCQRLKAN